MLKRRIIPTLLLSGGQIVKGRGFNKSRRVGSAISLARLFEARGVDELMLLDVDATPNNRPPDFKTIEDVIAGCFMPMSVGGGVRSLGDIRRLLLAGADKVVIGTATEIVPDAARKFGSQCVSVTINATDALEAAEKATRLEGDGCGEIVLFSVARDGTMDGYDLALIEAVAKAASVPVVAAGGARDYEDLHHAFEAGADAVAVGAMFQFTDATPRGAKAYLAQKGVPVRL